jgi:spiro-SPASM protein
MKNIAIVNGITLSPYVFEKIHGQKNTLDFVKDFIKGLPETGHTAFLLSSPCRELKGFDCIEKKQWTTGDMLREIRKKAEGFDNIFYFFADNTLINTGITSRMYANHVSYFADYTFADGYPLGLAPEILKPYIIAPLLDLLGDDGREIPRRDSLFELIKKDINSFDLETEISPVDLRILRAELYADCKRNFLLLERLAQAGAFTEQDILRTLQENGEILRTVPAYVQLQTVEGCAQACSYCPYPKFHPDMLGKKGELPAADLEIMLRKIRDLCEDAIMGISLWGEHSLHSRAYEIIEMVCAVPSFKLVIETAGLGWNTDALRSLSGDARERCRWIVSLDAGSPEMYGRLRGEGFEQAAAAARSLLELFPDTAYIQAVRMQQNEDELEKFYKEWKLSTEHIIIQKYDYFCGYLPQYKVTDLSPLKRFPCRHLKRDMCVLLDGTVPLCREDINKGSVLGNLLQQDPAAIWDRGNDFYLSHLREDYPAICKECDEYYTYNF